jgi:hypothetical protein
MGVHRCQSAAVRLSRGSDAIDGDPQVSGPPHANGGALGFIARLLLTPRGGVHRRSAAAPVAHAGVAGS